MSRYEADISVFVVSFCFKFNFSLSWQAVVWVEKKVPGIIHHTITATMAYYQRKEVPGINHHTIVATMAYYQRKEVPGINHHNIVATMAYYQRKKNSENTRIMLKHRSMYDGA